MDDFGGFGRDSIATFFTLSLTGLGNSFRIASSLVISRGVLGF